jgi:hypothetical protein
MSNETKKQIVHVTDTAGREYLGELVSESRDASGRWVTLSPAWAYLVQVQQTPQGQAFKRSLHPMHMLEGVERLECIVHEVTDLRADNTDYPAMVGGAEQLAKTMRAQNSGIAIAGELPRTGRA